MIYEGSMDFRSYVRDLTFKDCTIHELDLLHILHYCVELRQFKYISNAQSQLILRPSIIAATLNRSCRETLEEVAKWGDEPVIFPVLEDRMPDVFLEDWSKFSILERLDVLWDPQTTNSSDLVLPNVVEDEADRQQQIQQMMIQEFLQKLPPSLKFLRIAFHDLKTLRILKGLIIARAGYLPSLEEVIIVPGREVDLFEGPQESQNRYKTDLVELYASFGVVLKFC